MFTYRKELTHFKQRKKGSILLYQTFTFLMAKNYYFDTKNDFQNNKSFASATPTSKSFAGEQITIDNNSLKHQST